MNANFFSPFFVKVTFLTPNKINSIKTDTSDPNPLSNFIVYKYLGFTKYIVFVSLCETHVHCNSFFFILRMSFC